MGRELPDNVELPPCGGSKPKGGKAPKGPKPRRGGLGGLMVVATRSAVYTAAYLASIGAGKEGRIQHGS